MSLLFLSQYVEREMDNNVTYHTIYAEFEGGR